jgi:hypothetical protein
MKADVKPATPAWQLPLPSGVPEPIARLVEKMHADNIASLQYEASREDVDGWFDYAMVQYEAAEIAEERYLPLACDPRMANVWRELTRQRNGIFLHPARSGDQDVALVELFVTAVRCRSWRDKATSTRKQAEQERDRWLAKADELDRDAVTMGFFIDSLVLVKAAQTYRDHADRIYAAGIAMALEQTRWSGSLGCSHASRCFPAVVWIADVRSNRDRCVGRAGSRDHVRQGAPVVGRSKIIIHRILVLLSVDN